MRITIGDGTREAMEVLGIKSYPFTTKILVAQYWMLAKQFHPDKNGSEKDGKKFIRIKEAYDKLKFLAVDVSKEEKELARKKEEIDDLFKLTKVCPTCKGSGQDVIYFNRLVNIGVRPCTNCDKMNITPSPIHNKIASGRKTLYCKYCFGTGKFKQRSGRVVKCRACEGTGIWKVVKCKYCKGRGFVYFETVFSEVRTEYITCSRCKGTGKVELKPFNPVIKKAAVMI